MISYRHDISVPFTTHKRLDTPYLLQHIYQLTQGLVCPVLDFVPIEGLEILIDWFCLTVSQDLVSQSYPEPN